MLIAQETPEVEVLEVCVALLLAVVTLLLEDELELVDGVELLEEELDPEELGVELADELELEELELEELEPPGMVRRSPG